MKINLNCEEVIISLSTYNNSLLIKEEIEKRTYLITRGTSVNPLQNKCAICGKENLHDRYVALSQYVKIRDKYTFCLDCTKKIKVLL